MLLAMNTHPFIVFQSNMGMYYLNKIAIYYLRYQIPVLQIITIFHTDQPQAYIDGCATRRAVALKLPIFKRKKGFANLSLGLIYHSKALPQPPSRDTIPLMFIMCLGGLCDYVTWMSHFSAV
jgi:hypothetical protein